jgi:hypothetical protein
MASAGRCRWGMGPAGWWQGPDRGGVWLVRAWCRPLIRGVRRSILGDRWLAAGRNAATENVGSAAASRRPAGSASAGGSRGPGRPLSRWLCGGIASGSTRPGPSRATCGLDVAGLHLLLLIFSSLPRTRILARQLRSGTGTVGRDATLRASWAPAIVMTASVRICSSGSPGKLAADGGRRPVPDARLYPHRETSKYFPESGNLFTWRAGPS